MNDRQYVKRVGLTYLGVFISLSLYHVGDNRLDGEGVWGADKPFDSINELVRVAGWTSEQGQGFLTQLNTVVHA